MKCLQTGMKREAVQEERSRGKGESGGGGGGSASNASNGMAKEMSNGVGKDDQPESTCNSDMPLDRILEAQTKSEMAGENPGRHNFNHQEFNATGGDPNSSIFAQIVEFAKNLPLFSDLSLDAQVRNCVLALFNSN